VIRKSKALPGGEMKKISLFIALVLGAALVVYSACPSGEGGGGSASEDGCGGANEGCIAGNVENANTGGAVSEVTVSIAGTDVATGNTQGYFFADNVSVGEGISLCFDAPGFAAVCRTVTVVARTLLSLPPVKMQPVREQLIEDIDIQDGTVLDTTTGTRVELDAASICESDRTTQVVGDILCWLTPVDVTGGDIELSPGDFTADNGTSVDLTDTSAMIHIACSQDGRSLDICEGKSSLVRLSIFGTQADCNDATVNPASVTSWFFDTATGIWDNYATVAKNCGATVEDRYYTGLINRLGWWNAGRWFSSTCLRGTVDDGFGTIVPNAQMKCTGVDWQGMSYAYSTINATFCTRVKPAGQYSCVARKAAFQSDPIVGTAPDNTNKCSNETSCANIGQVDLTNPLARAIMSWGEEPEDLDTHFVGDGLQIYFNNKDYTQLWQKGSVTAQPYVLLDTDDTTGFGPEILTIVKGVNAGTYYYCVHNFSGQANGGLEDSGAVVQYFTDTSSRRYDVPTSNPNDYNVWRVFKLEINSSDNLTITTINEYADGSGSVADACEGN